MTNATVRTLHQRRGQRISTATTRPDAGHHTGEANRAVRHQCSEQYAAKNVTPSTNNAVVMSLVIEAARVGEVVSITQIVSVK